MVMQSAGIVKSSRDFAFDQAKKYSDLPQVSDMVKEVRFDPKRGQLYVHTTAYGYHARMLMLVDSQSTPHQIRYHHIKGPFVGMAGIIQFEELEKNRTEMSMVGEYKYDKLPMPQFFLTFGLEIAMQNMAIKMRSFIEEKYKKCDQCKK